MSAKTTTMSRNYFLCALVLLRLFDVVEVAATDKEETINVDESHVVAVQPESYFDGTNPPSLQSEPYDGGRIATAPSQMPTAFDFCLLAVSFLLLGYNLQPQINFDASANHAPDSKECAVLKSTYAKCLWCTGNGSPQEFCGFFLCEPTTDSFNETIDISDALARLEQISDICQSSLWCSMGGSFAPPADGARDESNYDGTYLGADTLAKKKAIVWILRVSSMLSACGGLFIIWDTMLSRKSNNSERIVYNRLLFGMACFDICTALAWSFASAAIPKHLISQSGQEYIGHDVPASTNVYRNVYGVRGTDGTCQAQAFFIQLGITSVFYNVSLATYYVLVIVYQWRETRLKSIQYYMHGFPLLVGMGLAFGILPVYDWSEYGCHLKPYPSGELWKVFVFVFVPIGFSIMWIGTSMLYVYVTVRRTAQASRRWRLGVGPASDRETQVFWQAVFYTMSFLITWPAIFAVYLSSADVDRYGFTIFVSFVTPLQGFNDCCVYLYPRLRKFWDWEQLSSTFNLSSVLSSGFMKGFVARGSAGTSNTAASSNATMPSLTCSGYE